MKKIIGIAFAVLAITINTWAAPKQLSAAEVNISKLKEIIGEQYGTSVTEGGMLIIRCGDGRQAFLFIDPEEKLIDLRSKWHTKPSVTKQQCLEMMNDWLLNSSPLSVAYDTNKKMFVLGHILSYKGGVIIENLFAVLTVFLQNDISFAKQAHDAGLLK